MGEVNVEGTDGDNLESWIKVEEPEIQVAGSSRTNCPPDDVPKLIYFKRNNLQNSAAAASSRSYKCHICSESFSSTKDLFQHCKIHTNPPKPTKSRKTEVFKCDKCSRRTFKTKNLLDSHMKTYHTEEKICSYCSKVFQGILALSAHVKEHKEKHVSKDFYKCSLCSTGFKRHCLYKHLRKTHKLPTDVAAKMVDKAEIMIPEGILTPHPLPQKQQKLDEAANLNNGASSNDDGTTFVLARKCPKCPNSFLTKLSLKRHLMRIHQVSDNSADEMVEDLSEKTGISYTVLARECPVCLKNFTTRDFLKLHLENFHKTTKDLAHKLAFEADEKCKASIKNESDSHENNTEATAN